MTFPVLTDTDIATYLGHVLQCYFLRSINEMQNPITYTNFESGKGISTFTVNPIFVPDAQIYPKNRLESLWKSVNLAFAGGGPDDPIWRHYPFKVPQDTNVEFVDESQTAYLIRFERKPDFRLDFKLTIQGRNIGIGTLPRNFVPIQPERIKNAYSYVFLVEMNFHWEGDRQIGEAYADWAQGLFAGFQKKLVIPDRN